jgi:hypothetical protein
MTCGVVARAPKQEIVIGKIALGCKSEKRESPKTVYSAAAVLLDSTKSTVA